MKISVKDHKGIEQATLYRGDCLDVMPTLGAVDMVLTDPPYGTTACKWDSIIPLDQMWDCLTGVTKDNAAIVMTASQPFTTTLISSNMEQFKYCWVWDKKFAGNFLQAKYVPLKIHEDIAVFSQGGMTTGSKNPVPYNPQKTMREVPIKQGANNYEEGAIPYRGKRYTAKKTYTDKLPETIIKFSSRSEGKKVHPTQKPVALMEYLIKTYTNEGDTVLDFTMGSGTTGVACANTNRKFIGIELDEGYFEIAKDRIEEAFDVGIQEFFDE